jgi:hypothetical protein
MFGIDKGGQISKIIKSLVRNAFRMVGLEIRRFTSEDFVNRIYSNFDEQSIVNGYLNTLSLESRYCVDIAASDGISMSNTYSLYKDGWGGLAVEFDARKFRLLQTVTLISQMSIWQSVW